MTFYWWTDLGLTCFIELPVLVVGNLLILVKLLLNAKKRKEQMHATSGQLNNSTIAMLIGVAALFVLTTAPRRIYILGLQYNIWFESAISSFSFFASMEVVTAFLEFLPLVGCATNFIAYCLSGQRFRSAVRAVFSKV